MGMRLYAGSPGWILVPDCITPPAQADVHGPLRVIGEIGEDELKPRELRSVLEAFDRQLFAMVPNRVGERLRRTIDAGQACAFEEPGETVPCGVDRDDESFAQP